MVDLDHSDIPKMTDAIKLFFDNALTQINQDRPEDSKIRATSEFTLRKTTTNRTFIISRAGNFGLAPAKTQRG